MKHEFLLNLQLLHSTLQFVTEKRTYSSSIFKIIILFMLLRHSVHMMS